MPETGFFKLPETILLKARAHLLSNFKELCLLMFMSIGTGFTSLDITQLGTPYTT